MAIWSGYLRYLQHTSNFFLNRGVHDFWRMGECDIERSFIPRTGDRKIFRSGRGQFLRRPRGRRHLNSLKGCRMGFLVFVCQDTRPQLSDPLLNKYSASSLIFVPKKRGEIMRTLFISLLLLTLVGCAHSNFDSQWPASYYNDSKLLAERNRQEYLADRNRQQEKSPSPYTYTIIDWWR